MRPKNLVQKFEFESLRVGEGAFSEKHFSSLARLAEKSDETLFKIGNKKVIFQNYVGVLQVGDLTIEVLPKADKTQDASHSKWREALFDMLSLTGKISSRAATDTRLSLRRGTLFDLYLESFLDGCELLVANGLHKKYVRKEGELTYYKGRVNFGKQFSQNAGNQATIITEYTDYNIDHTLHRILFYGIELVPHCTTNLDIATRARVLRSRLPNLPRPSIKDIESWRMILDRNTFRYKEALTFAELIIKSLSPVPHIGKHETISLLFDMNTLFEKYILKCLKLAQNDLGIEVRGQASKKFWESKTVRPDIVLTNGLQNFVIDTKWKVLSNPSPSDADLKQIYVYNNYFDSLKSLLLYPNVFGLKNRNGHYHKSLTVGSNQVDHSCIIGFVDLFENERLKQPVELAKQVWAQFHSESEAAA